MSWLTEKIEEVVSKELLNPNDKRKSEDLEKILKEMKDAGIIKKPVYNLPLVDTIGKTYYLAINKHK